MLHHYKNNKLIIIIFIILIAFIIPNLICYRIEQQRIEEEKMREGFIDDIIAGLTKPLKSIGNAIDDVTSGIGEIIDFIGSIPKMITNFITGISNHVNCGSIEFEYGWTNTFKVIDILTACVWDKFVNFFNGNCTRYYLTDLIIGLINGIFIKLPIILINAILGINLMPFIDISYELIIIPLDTFIYTISGFHLVKWSDDIINECYRCKGPYKFSSGNSIDIYKSFDEWSKLLSCSSIQMKNGFLRIYTSIVPSSKWGDWVKGKKMNGYE